MSGCSGLELVQEEKRLLASVHATEVRPPLDEAALRAFLAQSDYAGWALFDEALTALLASYNQSEACERLVIGEQRDGAFAVDIAEDAMAVWLDLTPACGGKPVHPDDVFVTLSLSGVSFGIDLPALKVACASATADRFLIASAIPAVNGEDARFELLVSDARDRTPHVNEKGIIDFRDLGDIPTVVADQPLMRRIPATPGKAGCNVRGEEIRAEPGYDAGFSEHLVGAYVDKEDHLLLRAVYSGQPVSCLNGVSVENVLRLRNVNVATGNIGFDGTVHIEGEVLPGMKVNATGDIIVGGVVDGATLVAGGDIRIGGGAIAKASIRAEGSVTVRFVESAQVYAGTTLAVEDSALQADLQANNQILVGLKNKNGKLAGGGARAMLLIQAPVFGSSTGGVTQLSLGVNPVLDAAYRDLLQLIEKRKEEEDKLDKLVKHLAKQGDKSGMLERATASRQLAIKAWGVLLPEREALEKQLERIAEAQVVVGVEVAGAVDVTFGKKVLRLRKILPAGVLSQADDQLVFTATTGGPLILN